MGLWVNRMGLRRRAFCTVGFKLLMGYGGGLFNFKGRNNGTEGMGGQPVFVNLFSTHTQASYSDISRERQVGAFFIQYDQMNMIKRAVHRVYEKSRQTLANL